MKKILIVIVSSIMLCLFMGSPSLVKAYTENDIKGQGYIHVDSNYFLADLYCYEEIYEVRLNNYGWFTNGSSSSIQYYYNGSFNLLTDITAISCYIPTLTNDIVITINAGYWDEHHIYFYKDINDYYDSLPEELRPEDPSFFDMIWDSFLDLWEQSIGTQPPSFITWLKSIFEDDDTDFQDIVFPTLVPTPTPTPQPTPIPVQTIFVPDGNGGSTVIYQYEDPTTGIITQTPYNPNIDIQNSITVDCNCNGNGSDNFWGVDNDPYTLLANLPWADNLGSEFTSSPLEIADDQQTTLKGAADEYTSSVAVMSNSFNVLPIKWITLAGLLGGILILAGLLRTFLGG